MTDWVQLGDGAPWYRELEGGEVQFCADGDPVSNAIGVEYTELDRLPRYAERLNRIAFFERAIELWKQEEADWDEREDALVAELDTLRARVRELEQAIRSVGWVLIRAPNEYQGSEVPFCPLCGATGEMDQEAGEHMPGCPVIGGAE